MEHAYKRGIYTLDHALLCNIPIDKVVTHTKTDPFIINCLRSWNDMGFYRNPFQQEEGISTSWEAYASMPIIYNTFIKVDGSVIDITNPNSPYSCLGRRRLYHVAQLYSNYSIQ